MKIKYWTVVVVLCVALSTRAFLFLIPMAIEAPTAAMLGLTTMATTVGLISTAQKANLQHKIRRQLPSEDELNQSFDENQSNLIIAMTKLTNRIVDKCLDRDTKENFQTQNGQSHYKNSPEECCKDYLNKFEMHIQKLHGGFALYKDSKHRKLQCCLEWDHLHGGFEIFDKNGHHMGERGCDDLSDDACEFTPTRGKHALPQSATHKPRTQLCSK